MSTPTASTAPAVTYYCILPQQPPDVGSAIRPISRLAQEDENAVRERLLAPTFQVFRRFAKRSNAEGFSSQLRALGVRNFLIADSDLQTALFVWAKRANRGGGGMAMFDYTDSPLYCPFADIMGVVIGTVHRDDGSKTVLVDFHRKSTPITPRIDASLFAFDQFLSREGATLEHFIEDLEQLANATVDRRFDQVRAALHPAVDDVARHPGSVLPPPDALPSPYTKKDLEAFNMYSFLLRWNARGE